MKIAIIGGSGFENPDILKTLSNSKPNIYTVGFALETENLLESATEKLQQKNLDMVIANQFCEDNQIIFREIPVLHSPRTSLINFTYTILKILIGLAVFSFLVALSENTLGNHLHSFLGFSEYNLIVNDIDPQGNYGLNWSFESQSASPRYAAFFADPLVTR